LVKDPDFFINNYFAELRNTMDLTKENNIQLIEENHARLIKETYDREKECKFKKCDIEISIT